MRGRKEGHINKGEIIRVRVTAEEKQQLREQADAAEKTISAYLRDLGLAEQPE